MKREKRVSANPLPADGLAVLTAAHPELKGIVSLYGPPPLWRREPGFSSLVYIILEQQVSLASARAAYLKLLEAVGELSPASFVRLDDNELRAIGFSRQKTSYCRGLANLIIDGKLNLALFEKQADGEVRDELMAVRGIGRWTADIYLLHSLGRPDIWPVGDLALRISYQEAAGLEERPSEDELDRMGEKYSPWRSVAARVLWHSYLSRRNLNLV